jgi:hypothetical protein
MGSVPICVVGADIGEVGNRLRTEFVYLAVVLDAFSVSGDSSRFVCRVGSLAGGYLVLKFFNTVEQVFVALY